MWNVTPRGAAVIVAHAFVGWGLCAATIGIGQAVASLSTALVVHAIGAPLFFAGISIVYFTRFAYTGPLQTAAAFTGFVVLGTCCWSPSSSTGAWRCSRAHWGRGSPSH